MPHPNTGLPLERRFWSKVQKSDGCWMWLGAKGGYGYGRILRERGGKMAPAHLLSWEMANRRSVPDGMRVLHRCDAPGCVRPDHLFLGTQRDNVVDMYRKGRGGNKGQRGEVHHRAKLTTEQVQEIRALYRDTPLSQRMVAERFGVCRATVGFITQGKTWR